MTVSGSPRLSTRIALWTYSALVYLAIPLVLVNLIRRGLRQRAHLARWRERFGWCARRTESAPVWVHAVSMGEVAAATPLIRALIGRYGPARIVVTCGTPTGSARIAETFGDAVDHCYLPYDLPGSVHRFLARKRPLRAVIVEAELWPNLYAACHRRGVPLVMVNARISASSARTWGRFARLAGLMLGRVTRLLAQSQEDASRFAALGAPVARVQAAGNIKFDLPVPNDLDARVSRLREATGWRDDGHCLVAGSVHPGEWPQVLTAFAQLRANHGDARLVLVPRHPERFDRAAREAADAGWRVARRSAATPMPDADVLVGDSMGELLAYFGLGDVAFVGGSLVPVGGHNVLEPALLGQPVVFGPHRHSFAGAGDALIAAGGGWEVTDADALARRVDALWSDEAARKQAGARAQDVIAANRGAVQRALAALDAIDA